MKGEAAAKENLPRAKIYRAALERAAARFEHDPALVRLRRNAVEDARRLEQRALRILLLGVRRWASAGLRGDGRRRKSGREQRDNK